MPAKLSTGGVTITKNRPTSAGPHVPPVVASDSLLATETEKHATSKSLYGDHKARISSNVFALNDRVRLRAFQSILSSLKGKTVLHIGCGMGLFSMMMARALAKSVLAVDSSTIVEAAAVVAQQNNIQNLTFQRCLKLTELAGRTEKFDVIVCEWMGSFLTNDAMLSDLCYVRDNLMAADGVICPDRANIHVVGISDYNYHFDSVEYWDNVYGFSMKPMKKLVLEEASVCHIPKSCISTNSCLLHTVAVKGYNDVDEHKNWTSEFTINATVKSTLHFLTFYIDCSYTNASDPGANFVIGFNPGGGNVWTEVSVPLSEAIPVCAGESISGTVKVVPRPKGVELEVTAVCVGSVATVKAYGRYIYQH